MQAVTEPPVAVPGLPPSDGERRTLGSALRAAVFAWSPRAYEFRLVCAALIAGGLARWAHLSMLWAIISAILVLQPDRRATQHNTGVRFIATLIGGAASVGVVALGPPGRFPRSPSRWW